MSEATATSRSVIVDRDLPHPPEKVWRALTEGHLIEEWLMKNDFSPVVGHGFTLRAEWGSVDCRVVVVEPRQTLAYSWNAYGLESVVTWTLSQRGTGTHLRMEQSGFRADQQQAYDGATHGWARFLGSLEQVLARLD